MKKPFEIISTEIDDRILCSVTNIRDMIGFQISSAYIINVLGIKPVLTTGVGIYFDPEDLPRLFLRMTYDISNRAVGAAVELATQKGNVEAFS